MLRASCDSDGWNLAVNKEKPYPTFFHILPASQIISVEVIGDITVRFVLAHISCLKADHCSSIFLVQFLLSHFVIVLAMLDLVRRTWCLLHQLVSTSHLFVHLAKFLRVIGWLHRLSWWLARYKKSIAVCKPVFELFIIILILNAYLSLGGQFCCVFLSSLLFLWSWNTTGRESHNSQEL